MDIEVQKKRVFEFKGNMFKITLDVVLLEAGQELLRRSVTRDYKKGDVVANVVAEFQEEMQEHIDKFKAEKDIIDHSTMNTAIGNLQNSLNY